MIHIESKYLWVVDFVDLRVSLTATNRRYNGYLVGVAKGQNRVQIITIVAVQRQNKIAFNNVQLIMIT